MPSPKIITPSLGADFNATYKDKVIDLGSVVKGDDGHDWCFVQASAAIAAAADVIVTEPAFTAAAGAGAWTTRVAIPINNFGWVRRKVI